MASDTQEQPSSNEMRAFAFRLLGRREYSVFELDRRIRQKWPEASGVQDLLDALVEENLLSDERFTESFVRFRIQRYQGPLKIKAALRTKGVSDYLISRELEGHSDEWLDLAIQWLDRQNIGEIDFNARKKYYRRLVSRGFTHSQAMDALNRK
ncbi:MAG: recombination regulator RecX [Xanthomonadales bacterium]|nr:recombination regulator RecX [Xanthomonadales bacterium]MDH4000711.1 recombination regulator RecX [Xanthomonadales bacterium]